MSFLDNLENSLKSLESTGENDVNDRRRQESDRAQARAIGPWVERLKTSPFTERLFEQAALTGHRLRTKIYMAWLENTLRLEARERKLDLRPTSDGIVADMIEPDGTTKSKPVDLAGKPEELLSSWLD